MTEDRLQLFPCPFCGGPAAFEEVRHALGASWAVGCANADEDCVATQSIATFSRRSEAAAAWNKRAPVLPFSVALDAAEAGLAAWREKPHNAKWWRRIDGTPIPNDLLVNIASALAGTTE